MKKDTDAECIGSNENKGGYQNPCAERTYSSREYYSLMKECLKKDHEITLLKRKVEALEYLLYACIPPEDRRAG